MINETLKNSDNFLMGIADYCFVNPRKKSKDRRTSPPLWMKFKLHQKEWREGYAYAKSLDINT